MQVDGSLDQADTLLVDQFISSVRVRAFKEYAHSFVSVEKCGNESLGVINGKKATCESVASLQLEGTRCAAARATHVSKPFLELEQFAQSLNAEHTTFDKSPSYSPSSPNTVNSSGGNDEVVPEELRGLDNELIEKIENEIVDSGERVTFDDIAGLSNAKSTVVSKRRWVELSGLEIVNAVF
jgi:hypothetical protein